VDIIETYGSDNIWMNSAADWGVSDPLATLKAANEMRMRGHAEALIQKIFYENPKAFLSQCPKFEIS
jgi:predicted metal-dependent TIM-barrel fold hydrolase